jgi:hypothetical protein
VSQESATPGPAPAPVELLQVTVPLTPAYSSEFVTVEETTATVSIPLIPGEQRSTTPEQVVGVVPEAKNPSLIGTLTVWSDYDPAHRVLTLLGNDFESSDSTCHRTYPQSGRGRTFKQHARPSDLAPSDTSPNWTSATDSTPELTELFRGIARSANEAIVEAALAQGLNVLVRTPPPELSPKMEEELRLVYQNGVFREAFDPNVEYGEDVEIVDIRSTYGGEMFLQEGTDFANVIGSTNDPLVKGQTSWRGLWESKFGPATICTSFHFPNNFPCGTTLFGGHVILGQEARKIQAGESGVVLIMPICVQHNNNNIVYMSALQNQRAIVLNKYLEVKSLPGAQPAAGVAAPA